MARRVALNWHNYTTRDHSDTACPKFCRSLLPTYTTVLACTGLLIFQGLSGAFQHEAKTATPAKENRPTFQGEAQSYPKDDSGGGNAGAVLREVVPSFD